MGTLVTFDSYCNIAHSEGQEAIKAGSWEARKTVSGFWVLGPPQRRRVNPPQRRRVKFLVLGRKLKGKERCLTQPPLPEVTAGQGGALRWRRGREKCIGNYRNSKRFLIAVLSVSRRRRNNFDIVSRNGSCFETMIPQCVCPLFTCFLCRITKSFTLKVKRHRPCSMANAS